MLGVASVVCVSSAVAGEMLQDLKVGHILGGTPWKMQLGDIIGIVLGVMVILVWSSSGSQTARLFSLAAQAASPGSSSALRYFL